MNTRSSGDAHWRRLGTLVAAGRSVRGMTQTQFAAVAGVSLSTVKNVEGGKTRRRMPLHAARLESALKWQAGSMQSVLDGGMPIYERRPLRITPGCERTIRAFIEDAPVPPGEREILLSYLEATLTAAPPAASVTVPIITAPLDGSSNGAARRRTGKTRG